MKASQLKIIVILAISLLFTGKAIAQTPTPTADVASITSPEEGETVSGLVTIEGTVTSSDFQKYEIFLSSGSNVIWVSKNYGQVQNGNLARLDTRIYQNGTYEVIIRKVAEDSNYVDFSGPTITIENEGGPLPYYPEFAPNYLYPVKDRAVGRLRNCSNLNLNFDYGSPTTFRSQGDIRLAPKDPNAICRFQDFDMIPGEYRGTARGEGKESLGYTIEAEAGDIFEFTYNGPEAGRHELVVEKIAGDERAGTDQVSVAQADDKTATQAQNKSAPVTEAVVVNPAATPSASGQLNMGGGGEISSSSNSESMLPSSGESFEINSSLIIISAVLILCLILGGVLAIRRPQS